jgi:arginase
VNKIVGIEYGRGCLREAINGGPALGVGAIKTIFPDADWTIVKAAPFDAAKCAADRFGENFEIQKEIYASTPSGRHILIGGDHSVNFGHFAAVADQMPNTDLCLVYIDAHFDIHTPATAISEASGAPHGTNVRALLGDGDKRWLSLCQKASSLKPENLFYLGTRSFEPSEAHFVLSNGIYNRSPKQLAHSENLEKAVAEIRQQIGGRPFVLSFDFDSIDPNNFADVLVPAHGGISFDAAKFLIESFKDAHSFEFVEYAPNGDSESASIVKSLIEIALNS